MKLKYAIKRERNGYGFHSSLGFKINVKTIVI